MSKLSKDEINTDLFDENQSLKREVKALKKVLASAKSFCKDEAQVYNGLKNDERQHKVNRIFANGKQRAFENVLGHISNAEEEI